MSVRMNRRDFLRLAALSAVGATAAACGATPTPVPPTATKPPAPAPTTAPAAPAAPTATKAPAAPTAAPAAPTATKAAATGGGTLNYAESGDFSSFNPWRMEAVNMNMHNQSYDRLVWKDGSGKENLGLAASYELAKDAMSAKIKVREGAKWSDGKEITAQDYVNMYGYTQNADLVKAEAGVNKTKNLMPSVAKVEATGKYDLLFTFKSPLPYFSEILDYFWTIRIDDPADPAFLKKPPVASGPFKLAEWVPNQYARLVRNENYWQTGKPILDTFMFRRLDKAETVVPNLQSGAVQGIFVSSAADVAQLQADKNLNVVITSQAGSMNVVMINVLKPPFDKKQVRQALSYSLNRVEMAKSAFFGVSEPIVTPLWSPTVLGYKADVAKGYGFDLNKAKALLEQAGVKNLEINTYVTPRWPSWKLYMLIWQADLAKIGVKLNIQEVEQAKFMEAGNDAAIKGLDIFPWLVGRSTRDPAVFLNTQTPYRPGTSGKFQWPQPELEKLISDGAQEADPVKRKATYEKINDIYADEQNILEVATDPRMWAWSNKVKNVIVDLVGNITLTDTTIS